MADRSDDILRHFPTLLRRWDWNRPEDYARSADPIRQARFMIETNPSPTLDTLDLEVSASFAARFLDAVGALELPARSHERILGLDGVMNGLALPDRDFEIGCWWNGPPGRQAFTDSV